MASKPVEDAVAAYLTANWTAVPIIDLNEGETPPSDGSAFLQVQYPVGKETFVGMASVGSRTFREEGVVRFVLSVPRGSSTAQGKAWIETLRDLFRAQTVSGVVFKEAAPATTGSPAGNYWVLSFAVAYYFDAFK